MNFGGTHISINKVTIKVLILLAFTLFVIKVCVPIYAEHFDRIYTGKINRMVSLKKLLQVAVQAAENGGIEVVSASQHDLHIQSKGKTKEGLENSVTIADYKSHCAMVATIKSAFPKVTLISEEKKDDCNTGEFKSEPEKNIDEKGRDEFVHTEDITVWIDPLDATHEYTQKLHKYVTTMVCVAHKGQPIIGVIHNPFVKNTTWAWVGHLKSADLQRVEQVALEQQEKVRIIVSMSHPGEVRQTLQKRFKDKELEIINAAGAGYKVLQVAGGLADAYVHVTEIKKWDICAGNAILKELGGEMTTKDGGAIDYSTNITASNKKGLIATLREHSYFVSRLSN